MNGLRPCMISLTASVKGFRARINVTIIIVVIVIVPVPVIIHVTTGAIRSCTAKAEGWHWGHGWGSNGPHPGPWVCEADPVSKSQWQARPTRDSSTPKRSTESELLLWGQEWATDATVCHTCWGLSIPRSQPSPQPYSRNSDLSECYQQLSESHLWLCSRSPEAGCLLGD